MRECLCVEKHVPLPMTHEALQVGGSVLGLCPTTFHNVMELMTEYKVYATVPPGSVTKHYSKYVREICLQLWRETLMTK